MGRASPPSPGGGAPVRMDAAQRDTVPDDLDHGIWPAAEINGDDTTKKGSVKAGKALGVNVNSNVTFGMMDKKTFPKYQTNYGGGYGPYYSGGAYPGLEDFVDVDGDGNTDLTVPFYEDASMGEKFDPSLNVYHWDAFSPESPNYNKAMPWVNTQNGADKFFETAVSYTNSVDISGGDEKSTFRLGYTNMNQTGIMPNSSIYKEQL